MSTEPTLSRLARALGDSLPGELKTDAMTPATPLDSFGVDSLVMIDLIFDLEQEFGVKLAVEELAAMKTVGDLVAYLDRRAAQQ